MGSVVMEPPSEWVPTLLEKLGEASRQLADPNDQTAEQLAAHESRVDRALLRLRARVKEQEAVLAELRSRNTATQVLAPSQDARARLRQLRVIKEAYTAISPLEPHFPASGSPLPALLTLRHTFRTISETKSSIQQVEGRLLEAQRRLDQEQISVRDTGLISQSLNKRIDDLRDQQQERSQKSPNQAAKDLVRALQRRKAGYEADIKRLVKAFNEFIDNHLAAMLAAEELGGPVVGDMMAVDDEVLAAGFSHQGKVKKAKARGDDSQRQRRIDQIWGQGEENDRDEAAAERSEKEAAGGEIRALTEELLNASAASGTGGSASYVELQRDSAAARFLVRAKVAQFHPRDARRLRLIDFGRDLDD